MGAAAAGGADGVTERDLLRAERWVYLVVILLLVAFAAKLGTRSPLGDFDFGTGLVRCAVGGMTTSCGSVAP